MVLRRNLFCLLMIGLAATGAGLPACSQQPLKLIETGDLYTETVPSSQVYFSDITASQIADELIVAGKVSRRNTTFSGTGRIDIAVVAPGGTVIDTMDVPHTPPVLPKTPGARRHRSARFEARLRCRAPHWSIIRIAYHSRPVSKTSVSEEENFALPKDYDYGG